MDSVHHLPPHLYSHGITGWWCGAAKGSCMQSLGFQGHTCASFLTDWTKEQLGPVHRAVSTAF